MRRYEADKHAIEISNTDFQLFKEGSEKHFELLFRKHYRYAWSICSQYIADKMIVDEIVIESFYKVWQRRENLETLKHFTRSLATMIINASKNHVQQEHRTRRYKNNYVEFSDNQSEQEQDAAFNSIVEVELLQMIYIFVERLPPECKRVFKMYFLQDMGTEDIASKLQISSQTVRNHKANAIKMIQKSIARSLRRKAQGLA